MFGPFTLQWRTPSPNPPAGTPLPEGITRTYVQTVSGPLELLSAPPLDSTSVKPPLFFAHGGFGCASVWLAYISFFSKRGYPCYAVSYRGHGKSWYPGFWRMYFTSRGTIGGDLVAGIEKAERIEMERRKSEERVGMVLIGHSAGGALCQWSCYRFWLLSAPLNFCYRLFHSKYLLATTEQVHGAFFSPQTPTAVVMDLERLLAPYESMLWPMQALSAFVTGPDVIQHITGWIPGKPASADTIAAGITSRFLVLAAERDVLCMPSVLLEAAKRYRAAFHECVRMGKLDGVSESDVRFQNEESEDWDGVTFKVVKGLAHHLQNHVEWERGAEEVMTWAEKL